MAIFIKDYTLYFYIKTPHSTLFSFLKPLKLPAYLWTNISINYIITLLVYQRHGKAYKYIFIIIDCLTKMQYLILVTGLSTKELVNGFINNIYKLYNVLNTIIFNYSI